MQAIQNRSATTDVCVSVYCRGFAEKRSFFTHLWQELTRAFGQSLRAHVQLFHQSEWQQDNSSLQYPAAPVTSLKRSNTLLSTTVQSKSAQLSRSHSISSFSTPHTSFVDLQWMDELFLKRPQSFSELCMQLPDLLYVFNKAREKIMKTSATAHSQMVSRHSSPNSRVFLLLQHVDVLNTYEVGLCEQLLQLVEVSIISKPCC